MKKTLLVTGLLFLTASSFAQVPPPQQPPVNDSVFNDSIFFHNELSNVVLIGYGTKKAGAITGSVVQIKAEDIIHTPAQSAIQAIQGKAAGVNIVTNDEPGASPSIRIRGIGTIIGGREPLYVIDGVETDGLNGLNPNDIETINILKDASSLAIYGQKGSNGVVLITTKKGKRGNIKVSYNGYYGQKFIQRKVEMADSYRFAYYSDSASGDPSKFNFEQPYNTDWLDEITETGQTISHSLSLSGAGENADYYFGVSNYQEKGILIGTRYERTNVINKNTFRLLDDKLKITSFINLANSRTTPKPLSAFTNAYKQSPIMPVKYDNGRWGQPFVNDAGINDMTGDKYNNVANPVAQLYYTNEQNKSINLTGSLNAELDVLDYLKFNSNFGGTAYWDRGYTYTPTRDLWLVTNPTLGVDDYIAQNPNSHIVNTLQQRRSSGYRWNWDNYFTFHKYFGDHNVTAVAGLSRTTFNVSDFLNATRRDVPEQSNYWSLDLSSDNATVAPGSVIGNTAQTPIVSIAYFARAEYDYKGKYLLSASVRDEGISSFQGNKKYNVFPAVSAGWVITDEDFMENVKVLNYLKIRGGYGEVGNAFSLPLNRILFAPGYNYTFSDSQVIFPGSVVPFQVDPDLTWETMKEIDLGLDFAFTKNRLTGTVDFYDRKTDNILLPINIPDVLSPDPVFLNSGLVENQGAELTLKWSDAINDNLHYSIGGNFSYNKNELKKVYSPFFGDYIGGGLGNGQYTKQVLEGEPLGTFYVYEVTGFNSDGGFTYSENRKAVGSYIPKYTYGFNITLNYRNFDFSVDSYGVGGNKLYNGKKAQRFGGENIESSVLDDFWTPSTPNATNPRPSNEVPIASTYFVEKGDYLRINNITLGYTLPKLFDKLDKVRIYATALNPFLFTKFTGYSPELVGNANGDPLGSAGIELDAYPTNKTFLFGVNIGF